MILITLSIIATLIMTGFSYLVSFITKQQFREPELLNRLVASSIIPLKPNPPNILGWIIHFIIGYVLSLGLLNGWKILNISFLFYGISGGIILGIIGIIGWYIMLKINPNPPQICRKPFYSHLIFAHIIFSLSYLGGLILTGFNYS